MRILAVLVILAAHALATPLYTKTPTRSRATDMIAAERAWQAAEHEHDPKQAIPLWQAAAAAFERAAPVGGKEALYAAVLAWKNANALDPDAPTEAAQQPTAFTTNEAGMFRVMGAYLPFAGPDELPGFVFLRANLLRRHAHYDEAVPMFAELVTKHAEHETAEYAANLLLDTLNRQGKYDELAVWVDRMRADKKLLAKRGDLAASLDNLHVSVLRKRAEEFQRAGAAGDRSAYASCAQTYRDALAQHPHATRADEMLFNAGVCLELEGATIDAVAAFRELEKRFPRSQLAPKARAHAAQLKRN
jgi:hypothetical protein